jgi:hypothetical protein
MLELELDDWVRLELLRLGTHCLEKGRPDLFRRLMVIQKAFSHRLGGHSPERPS